MNILLVYPEIPETFWSFKYALKFVRKKASNPPLGLVTIAAMLPTNWNKRLIDLNVTRLRKSDLQWADFVFLSAMVVQRKSVLEVIQSCQEAGVKIVAGGPLFTQEPKAFTGVDHFVLNEAEITLPEFLDDLENGTPRHIYSSDKFADLSRTPAPLWELLMLGKYESLSIQFTRGCPFNCEFCNVTTLLGHQVRYKTVSQILHELDRIYQLGWRRNIFFVDDNFIGNKKYLKRHLLPALINWRKDKIGCRFITEVSINLADDPDLVEMMVDAGFISVFIGIETPEEESLAECNKNQNCNRNLVESVKNLQRAGLQVMGGFIVGFDSDTPSIFQRQIDFIQKSGIVTAMVGLLQAPNGTRLYERLKGEGRLLQEMSGDNADGTTNIIPKMDLKILKQGYQQILENIYSPRPFVQRVQEFLREYKLPKVSVGLSWAEIRAFFRSVFVLGIHWEGRLEYWRLFFWSLFHYPRKFPMAITFAIYGYHFNKISRLGV